MPPKKGVSQGGLGSRTGLRSQGGTNTNPPEPSAGAGAPAFDPNNPYAPGALPPRSFYGPGFQGPTPTPSLSTPSQRELGLGEDHDGRERRARCRAAAEAALAAEDDGDDGDGGDGGEAAAEPRKRKGPRKLLVDRINEAATRVTRSAVERDEELGNCLHCSRAPTRPPKCHGGDECIECEVRGIACNRGNKRHFDVNRRRQLEGVEPWRPDVDQCQQCKSRGSKCFMPNTLLPGPCDMCRLSGLECSIEPLPVRRCPNCHWEHKCVECARNHLRCDGKIPCLVCVRRNIECVGLKPDGSCPDIPISTYGTGLPPPPQRMKVRPTVDMRNWPPPSGRLEISGNVAIPGAPREYQVLNVGAGYPGVAGPAPGAYVSPYAGPGPAAEPAAGPTVGIFPPPVAGPSLGPSPGPVPGPSSGPFVVAGQLSDPFAGPSQSPPVAAGPSSQPPGQNPGSNPNNFRNSLYSPFDDDKPPCSHCRADPQNRICDQDTPCWECSQRGILEPEDCRTSRPCELCFMNELPCDAGSPCQNCMFLGFGVDECRPEGLGPQQYFPDNPEESDDEPYIRLPGQPEFDYSCAFCVAYGFQGCDPRDRPCLPCIQHGRTALQCRFEERCARCIELDVPCDGKMPCSLCANADGLTSMTCLGRGDTTMPGTFINEPPQGGGDIPMGEGGDYPPPDGFAYQFPPQGGNDPFAPPGVPQEYVDPAALVAQGIPGQSILPQEEVPRVPPGGFFFPPAHVRETLLPHYRIRTDVYANGQFDPQPGAHVNWRPWNENFRCKETLASGYVCNVLPTMDCDGGEQLGDGRGAFAGRAAYVRRKARLNSWKRLRRRRTCFAALRAHRHR
ncbi:hypothetical protein VE04_08178 [Pseudogymnoascus sp. 24MN13]|nr:hypothetical protein VE04_08178 [Pseudogymnoascus sp. 24MN13]